MGLFGIFRKLFSSTASAVEDAQNRHSPAQDCYAYKGSVDAYFFEILSTHFPEYSIDRDIRVNLASEKHVPVTFMLTKDGRRCLAIILCHGQEYNRTRIVNTMRTCTALGIPVQRYFTNFRNSRDYVCNRITEGLN